MIRNLIAAMLMAPALVSAQAQPSTDVMRHCDLEGIVFSQAASFRDSQLTPQEALGILKRTRLDGITEKFLKTAINLVYFDGRFVNAGGDALRAQVAEACMYPNGRYKPLE